MWHCLCFSSEAQTSPKGRSSIVQSDAPPLLDNERPLVCSESFNSTPLCDFAANFNASNGNATTTIGPWLGWSVACLAGATLSGRYCLVSGVVGACEMRTGQLAILASIDRASTKKSLYTNIFNMCIGSYIFQRKDRLYTRTSINECVCTTAEFTLFVTMCSYARLVQIYFISQK